MLSATVPVVAGNVIVVESVPAKVTVLLTVNVLPSSIVNVDPVAGAVIVTLLTVLFVNASLPARVANVPVVGKVIEVMPVAVNVRVYAPACVTLPASVKVLDPLFTPVPP